MRRRTVILILCFFAAGCGPQPGSQHVRVAVAASFAPAAAVAVERFEEQSPYRVRLASGATGALYAQIRHGAPFDLYLAADTVRPTLLWEQGAAVASPACYAVGRLALWAPGRVAGPDLLREGGHTLAMANPAIAPYGKAAAATMEHLGIVWDGRTVQGENVGQALQFVATGNAGLGFVALAQRSAPSEDVWPVPDSLHPPLVHGAARLTDHPGAQALLDFMIRGSGRELIARAGYLPCPEDGP